MAGGWTGKAQRHVVHRVLHKFKFIPPFVRPFFIESPHGGCSIKARQAHTYGKVPHTLPFFSHCASPRYLGGARKVRFHLGLRAPIHVSYPKGLNG